MWQQIQGVMQASQVQPREKTMPSLCREPASHSCLAVPGTCAALTCMHRDGDCKHGMSYSHEDSAPVLWHAEGGGAAQACLAHHGCQHRGKQDHGNCEARGLQRADGGADLQGEGKHGSSTGV